MLKQKIFRRISGFLGKAASRMSGRKKIPAQPGCKLPRDKEVPECVFLILSSYEKTFEVFK